MSKHIPLLLALTPLLGCSTAGYIGAPSDHFDGKVFRNHGSNDHPGFTDVLRWQLSGDAEDWPDTVPITQAKPPARVEGRSVRVTMVNHATLLVQMDGLNILTDPVWSERVSPLSWAGPARHKEPGIAFEDLPPIDVVVLSHDHYDHCDVATLKRLDQTFQPVIIAGLGMDRFLADEGITGVVALDWWQEFAVGSIRVAFAPAEHWTARAKGARNHRLWGSYVFRGMSTVYFAGDTGMGPHFEEVHARYGRPRLALLPIGAYAPRWFMKPQHMDPPDAVAAAMMLDAEKSIAMHWGTFDLSDEGIDRPLIDLEHARSQAGLPRDAFITLENGASYELP